MQTPACPQVSACTDVIKLLRIQRHDFLNHLQVIHAMIQLGRGEKALQYIETLAHDTDMISNVLAEYKDKCI